jgi:hypothetical protein
MTDSASDDFGTLAVVMGFLTEKQREAVRQLQKALAETGVTKRFGEVCLDRKFLTRDQLAVILNALRLRNERLLVDGAGGLQPVVSLICQVVGRRQGMGCNYVYQEP